MQQGDAMRVKVKLDTRGLQKLEGAGKAIKAATRKAGATALRDMRAEASKRIRKRKRLKASTVREAIRLRKRDGAVPEFAIDFSGKGVPLRDYPNRQTKKGVSVEVNRGKRTLVKSAFQATMTSGHRGVFRRDQKARLPISELFGSRPVDAMLHQGESEAVAERGRTSFAETFERVLPLELDKLGGGK
jgi:hypothetical protein